jgi:hypothetical protein
MDEVLVLIAQVDECAFGHAELFGDAPEAEVLGSEGDEFLNFLVFYHGSCCFAQTFSTGTEAAPQPINTFRLIESLAWIFCPAVR